MNVWPCLTVNVFSANYCGCPSLIILFSQTVPSVDGSVTACITKVWIRFTRSENVITECMSCFQRKLQRWIDLLESQHVFLITTCLRRAEVWEWVYFSGAAKMCAGLVWQVFLIMQNAGDVNMSRDWVYFSSWPMAQMWGLVLVWARVATSTAHGHSYGTWFNSQLSQTCGAAQDSTAQCWSHTHNNVPSAWAQLASSQQVVSYVQKALGSQVWVSPSFHTPLHPESRCDLTW